MFTECINEFSPLADGLKSFPNHSFGCSFLGLFPAYLPSFHQKRHLTDMGSPLLLFRGSQRVSCPYSPNSLFGFRIDGILDSWGMPGSWRCLSAILSDTAMKAKPQGAGRGMRASL